MTLPLTSSRGTILGWRFGAPVKQPARKRH
jgi:hypothetical protein